MKFADTSPSWWLRSQCHLGLVLRQVRLQLILDVVAMPPVVEARIKLDWHVVEQAPDSMSWQGTFLAAMTAGKAWR